MTTKASSSPARRRATSRSSLAARSSGRGPRRLPAVTGSAAASIRLHSLPRADEAAVGGRCCHVEAARAPAQLVESSLDCCLAIAETHLPKALRWFALVPYLA